MEVCFQSGEGVWSRAGPAHDPLFVVSDTRDDGAAAPEDRIEEIILGEGGVLKLVDEDEGISPTITRMS